MGKVQQLDITPLNAHQHMELLRAVKRNWKVII